MICRLKKINNIFEILCPKYLCIVSIHLVARRSSNIHSSVPLVGGCLSWFSQLSFRMIDTNDNTP